jgi:hypothetical protein
MMRWVKHVAHMTTVMNVQNVNMSFKVMTGDQQGFYCEADHSSRFIVEPYLHMSLWYIV